ncbi:MAG: hypothetical protein M1813_005998 [Trichoglossum hirsutum]|nr:MAG: hypothetical protein M1813_005998 [Trichoglossum hirsutum]
MMTRTLSLSSLTLFSLLSLLSLAKADQQPNATGSFSFPGLPFTNTTPVEPWTLQYQVTQSLTNEGLDTKREFNMVTPSDNLNDNSTAWDRICILYMHNIFPNTTDTVKDENGDCGKTLSKECSDALKETPTSPRGSTSCEGIVPSKLPSACQSFFPGGNFDMFTFSINVYKGFTGLNHTENYTSKDTGLASKYYQESLKKITPILVRQFGPDSIGASRLVCARQTEVKNGSVPVVPGSPTTAPTVATTMSTLKPTPTSGAAVTEGWSGAALLSIAIVAVGFSLF